MIQYRNANGKQITKSSRTTDKRAAQRIADKLDADVALRREGVIDGEAEDYAVEARRPVAFHVDAYEAHLVGNRSAPHAAKQASRIRLIVTAAKLDVWRDVTADRVERAMGELAEARGWSGITRNAYLTAFNAYGNWMVKRRRAERNPVACLERATVPADEARRSMVPDEVARLIAAAEAGDTLTGRTREGRGHHQRTGEELDGGVRWSMTGAARGLLYRVAVETGARRSAIARLTVADFDLTGAAPAVTLKAKANTKSRRDQLIPLRVETAASLADHFVGKLPAASAFNMPADHETAGMLKADLAAARVAWIAEGDTAEERAGRAGSAFLAEQDAEGRKLDFHALRTTCASWLNAAGVSDAVAMRITGHTQAATLRRHYQRADMDAARRAVEALPVLRATGTDDRPHRQHQRQQMENKTVQNGAAVSKHHGRGDGARAGEKTRVAHKKTPSVGTERASSSSSRGWIRTNNQVINSHLLYR